LKNKKKYLETKKIPNKKFLNYAKTNFFLKNKTKFQTKIFSKQKKIFPNQKISKKK